MVKEVLLYCCVLANTGEFVQLRLVIGGISCLCLLALEYENASLWQANRGGTGLWVLRSGK
jgi:hypothetical protein